MLELKWIIFLQLEKNKSVLVGLEIFSSKENKFYKPDMQYEPPDRRDHIAVYLI